MVGNALFESFSFIQLTRVYYLARANRSREAKENKYLFSFYSRNSTLLNSWNSRRPERAFGASRRPMLA